MRKNMALKEGVKRKNGVFKGRVTTTSFKYGSDSICNNANSLPRMPKTSVPYIQKFKFSWGSMPRTPYFIMRQKVIRLSL